MVFLGTAPFAVPSLRALVEAGHDVAEVWTRPPRPAGRGLRPRPSAIASEAERLGLAVATPARLGAAEAARLAALAPDAVATCAYGLLLPPALLGTASLGAVNVHASLLPRWRGAAPIERAIENGDRQTGVTIFRLDEGMDTGPILLQEATPIGPDETAGEVATRLAPIGARLLVRALEGLADGSIAPRPQGPGATRAPKVSKEACRIDWSRPARSIHDTVRAMNPAPGAWTERGGERIAIWRTRIVDGPAAPGAWLEETADGRVEIVEAQRPGRRRMSGAEVLRGLR